MNIKRGATINLSTTLRLLEGAAWRVIPNITFIRLLRSAVRPTRFRSTQNLLKVDNCYSPEEKHATIINGIELIDVHDQLNRSHNRELSTKADVAREARFPESISGMASPRVGDVYVDKPTPIKFRDQSERPEALDVEIIESTFRVMRSLRKRNLTGVPLSPEELQEIDQKRDEELRKRWTIE